MALFFSGVFTVINTVRVKRWDLIFGSPGNRGPGMARPPHLCISYCVVNIVRDNFILRY